MVLHRKNIFLLTAILGSLSRIAWSFQIHTCVQDLCGTTLDLKGTQFGIESSAILKPKQNGDYEGDVQGCSVLVKVPTSKFKLVLSYRTLDLRPHGDTLEIEIQHGDSREKLTYTSSSKMDDPKESKREISTGDVIITFNTRNEGDFPTSNYKGFQLTVTLVQDAPCSYHQFRCNDGKLCISDQLKCDGHNHCGDRSDQLYCFGSSTTTSPTSPTGTPGTTVTTGSATSTKHDTGLVLGLAIGGIALLSASFY